MIDKFSTKWVAAGLLGVSILALAVGLLATVNTVNSTQTPAIVADKKEKSQLLSALGKIAKGDTLMYISLSGPIMMQEEDSGLFGNSESNAVKARKALEAVREDKSVKGVLLMVNSPGGTVGMSQELNAAVARLEKEKPVVAYFGDVSASGGYYTSVAATKIVANPGTLTGSIGVIISTLNFRDLMTDKLGVAAYTFKSGKYKDLLSPYRKPSSEELALVQALIDTSYEQFLNAVIQGRTKYVDDPEKKKEMIAKIKSVADGRILVGSEAKKMGLVDEIGDIDVAYELLNRMAKERFKIKGKDRLPLEEYSDTPSLMEMLGFSAKASLPSASSASPLDSYVPFSMKHPNQPLWIME